MDTTGRGGPGGEHGNQADDVGVEWFLKVGLLFLLVLAVGVGLGIGLGVVPVSF
jgi:hypothetical protein